MSSHGAVFHGCTGVHQASESGSSSHACFPNSGCGLDSSVQIFANHNWCVLRLTIRRGQGMFRFYSTLVRCKSPHDS